jgi:hypothetical protein
MQRSLKVLFLLITPICAKVSLKINTHKGLPCGNEGFIRKLSDKVGRDLSFKKNPNHIMLQSSKSVVFYVRYIGTMYMKKWKTKYDTLSTKSDSHIDGVMISVLASSVVDRGFEPRSG